MHRYIVWAREVGGYYPEGVSLQDLRGERWHLDHPLAVGKGAVPWQIAVLPDITITSMIQFMTDMFLTPDARWLFSPGPVG